MRGYKDFNFPAFDAERDALVAKGYKVISPADLDRAEGHADGDHDGIHIAPDDVFALYMRRDIKALLKVDAIRFLPGWQKSRGANVENVVGQALNLVRWFPHQEVPSRV